MDVEVGILPLIQGFTSARMLLTLFREVKWSFVGPLQVYPLILSLAIMVQGIIFAVAQSQGLQTLLIEGCTPVSQMMMPGKLSHITKHAKP